MRGAHVVLLCLVAGQAVQEAWGNQKGKENLAAWVSKYKKNAQKLGYAYNVSQAISGGATATDSDASFATINTNVKQCGGALISESYVLSAASCTEYSTVDVRVRVGYFSESQSDPIQDQMVPFGNIFHHPDYNCENLHYDLSIIQLPTAIVSNDEVWPIRLPTRDEAGNTYENTEALIVGFGSTEYNEYVIPGDMQYKMQEVKPPSYCQNYGEFSDFDSAIQICTMRTDERAGPCLGDEGGPLSIDVNGERVLIGITSFQPYICPIEAGFPARHAKVAGLWGWLEGYATPYGEVEEPEEPPEEPPVEEPVDPPVEEPVDPPVEEPVDPPVEEPVDPPVEEPVDPPVEEPVDPPVEEPVDPPVEEPVDPPVEEPVDPPVEEPVDPPVEEPPQEGGGGGGGGGAGGVCLAKRKFKSKKELLDANKKPAKKEPMKTPGKKTKGKKTFKKKGKKTLPKPQF